MNAPIRLLAALAVAVSLGSTARAQTIRLGAILPLTGPGTVIGTQEQRGISFAVDEANAAGGVAGHQIEVLFEDNQAKPDLSILSFNKLVDLQGVPMLFTGFSGPTLAMAPLATRKKILMINSGAQADKLATASPYLINTLPKTADEVAVMAHYLVAQGKKKAVVLYENDAAGIGGRDDFAEAFPKAGGTILAQETVQFGQTDVRPALLKLAAEKPDVLYVVTTTNTLQLAQQFRQLDLGFTLAGTSFLSDPTLQADPVSNGIIHTQVKIDAPPALAAAFRAKYGQDMDFFARQYYNGTKVVLTVLAKVLADGHPVTGEALRQTLLEIRSFTGLIPMEFKTNTAASPIVIKEMRDGREDTLAAATAE